MYKKAFRLEDYVVCFVSVYILHTIASAIYLYLPLKAILFSITHHNKGRGER